MRWVDPAFSAYPLAERYTGWLYGDPQSNPRYWDQPNKWPESGVVVFQDREIKTTFAAGSPVGTVLEVPFNLTGGKNCVVFARFATVPDTAISLNQQLPTQLWSYVLYSQRLQEGYLETQETALCNVFGTSWRPHYLPAPITWNDKLRRSFFLTNNTTVDTTEVTLGWKVAYLNTGA